MKGSTNIYWTIGAFLVILVTVLIFAEIFPRIMEIIMNTISKTSSGAVAHQLSGLISVAGAAPGNITITYQPSSEAKYLVYSLNRIIWVKLTSSKLKFLKKSTEDQPYCVPLNDFNYKNVNKFTIKKINNNGVFEFEFSAE